MAVLALQHRQRQLAKLVGPCLDGKAADPAQKSGKVQEAVEKPGRMPEEGRFLLKEDIDAAKEDAVLTDVVFIRANRRIGRDEQGVMPLGDEGGDERIVAHTTATEHAG